MAVSNIPGLEESNVILMELDDNSARKFDFPEETTTVTEVIAQQTRSNSQPHPVEFGNGVDLSQLLNQPKTPPVRILMENVC